MKWHLSQAADKDLEQILTQSIVLFGDQQALRYLSELEAVFELIAHNPAMARLRTELQPPARAHPHKSHIIIYEETADGITILRIRHAREDWSAAE